MAYLVDDLLSDAKVRANFPTSNGSITDAELLQLGNDEFQGILTGRLTAAMQDYFAAEVTVPIVAGQSVYDIPTRAIGARLNYVALVDGSGQRQPLPHMSQAGASMLSRVSASATSGYFIQGSQIVLVPAMTSASMSLVIGFFQRPGRLVFTTTCAMVYLPSSAGATVINVANGAGQVATGNVVDIVKGTPHFVAVNQDVTLSTAGAGTITIPAPGAGAALGAGDYVCLAGTSCVVQLPVETQPLMSARWALRILRQRGDLQQAEALKQDVADLEANLYTYLSNRVEAQVETIQATRGMGARGFLAGWTGWSF